jgi:hypothetical protein
LIVSLVYLHISPIARPPFSVQIQRPKQSTALLRASMRERQHGTAFLPDDMIPCNSQCICASSAEADTRSLISIEENCTMRMKWAVSFLWLIPPLRHPRPGG